MRDSKSSGRKTIQEVQTPRARKAKLERLRPEMTERKRAEEELKRSKEWLANIINALDDPVFVKDEQHRWVVLNDAACEVMGRPREELIGKSDYDLFSKEQADVFWERDDLVLKNGETDINEEEITWHGKLHTISTKKSVFTDSATGKKFIAGTIRDITERKQAEEELKKSKDLLEKTFLSLNSAVFILDSENPPIIMDCNTAACRIFGYEKQEMLSKTTEFLHVSPETLLEFQKILYPAIQKEGHLSFSEFQMKRKNGQIFPTEHSVNPLKDDKGNKTGWVSVVRDITERKKAEESLRLERDNFVNILDSMEDGVYIVDQNHDIQYVNPVLKKDFGPFEGRKCYEYFHDRKETCPWCKNEEVVAGKTVRWEWYSSKNQRTYDLIDTPLRNPDGSISKLEIFRDITERKHAEEALRKSEMKYRELIELAQEGIWVIDKDSETTFVNPSMARILGYTPDEMQGKYLFSFMDEQGIEIAKANVERRQQGIKEQHDFEFIRKDGHHIFTTIETAPILDEAGNYNGAIAGVIDITERKKAEETLQKKTEELRVILDSVPAGIWYKDTENRVIRVNKAGAESIGMKVEDIEERAACEIFPDDAEHYYEDDLEVIKSGKPKLGITERMQIPGGEKKWVHTDKVPYWDEQGNVAGLIAFVMDITERKKAEETLRESEERYRAIFEQAADSIVLIDAETGTLVEFNNKAHENLGYTHEEFQKLKIHDFEVIETAEEVGKHIQKIVRDGADVFETKHRRKNGQIRDILVSSRAISIGGRAFVQSIWRDITERKKAEKKLLDYQGQLKSLASQLTLAEERERRRIATELHDQISQSLVISKMKVDRLRESASGKELNKALDEIANSLGRTIADTRSLTSDIHPPLLALLGFEEAVAEWLSEQIQKKHGIAAEFEDDGLPKPLDDDIRILLFRDVRELLTNVVKHAHAHKVKVSVRKVDDKICVTVEDDGVGFDPAEVASIGLETNGFGLFSIQERLEELGGNVDIESKSGHGTRVTITAPLKGANIAEGRKI